MGLALLACGSSTQALAPGDGGSPEAASLEDGGSSGDAGTRPPAAPGQLALRIHQVRQHRTDGAADTPLLVTVTLANGEGGAPVLLTRNAFKLRVASGLLKMPTYSVSSADLAWVDGKMPAEGDSLAGGASFGPWILAFAPLDAAEDAPVELTFELPSVSGDAAALEVRSATSPVALETCTECASPLSRPSVCTYLDRDPLHCGSCGVTDGDTFGVYGADAKGSCKAGGYVCGAGLIACANTRTRNDGYSYMGCYEPALVSRCDRCVATADERCVSNYCLASCTP
ncbi:MAG: hypothetical protein JWP97_5951 [Labilithrix sp.]|nr:hypothetical protein [Labilithrix sp.]